MASIELDMRHSLRGFDADLFDWADDVDAAIEHLAASAPGLPLYVVGHGAEGKALRRQFAAARFPVIALSMTDDELMTERGTRVTHLFSRFGQGAFA